MKTIIFSKIGKREVNQDYVLNEKINSKISLYLIADGMGGYADGEIAARLVADSILGYLSTVQKIDASQIQKALNKANLAVKQHSEKINEKTGATIGGVLVSDKKAICFWVGDVKVFHFKNKKLVKESSSHNLMNEMVRNGSIKDVKRLKRYKHVVTRSVQGDIKHSQIGVFEVDDIDESDTFVICSDGVHNLYEGLQIQYELNSSSSYQDAFDNIEKRLLEEAIDNFSLLCVYDFKSESLKIVNDKSAVSRWDKSNISYKNYKEYLSNKPERFVLSLIDLLFISNFKGGNASIHEDVFVVNEKLISYSEKLKNIDNRFGDRKLNEMTGKENDELIDLVMEICALTNNKASTKIDGFGPSYLSALLNAYFPDLIPILDRRVLINLKLVRKTNVRSGQILKIEDFYAPLIKKFAELSKQNKNRSFRDIDRKYFSMRLDVENLE